MPILKLNGFFVCLSSGGGGGGGGCGSSGRGGAGSFGKGGGSLGGGGGTALKPCRNDIGLNPELVLEAFNELLNATLIPVFDLLTQRNKKYFSELQIVLCFLEEVWV